VEQDELNVILKPRRLFLRRAFPAKHKRASKRLGARLDFRFFDQPIRRTTMTTFKILIAAALVSMTAVTAASAQSPNWAIPNPDAYQAQFPNGGAQAPAGRMGLNNAYAATVRATASSCVQRYHSYDPASGTFLGYDGRRHACE
jgi:hypothetical protein